MADIFNLTFLSYFKVLIVAILIYAIVYSILYNLKFLDDKKEVNAIIALLTAIIVSFSGVVTYSISYAINWFIIIIFIVFLMMMILMFLGIKMDDIATHAKDNAKPILIAFGILFLVIFVKSFFALNNSFDTSNPPGSQYDINTSFNTGVDDITGSDDGLRGFLASVDRDIWSSVFFLLVIGSFVWIIGRD